MYQNCNLIKCIHNLSNSIALCLGGLDIYELTNTYKFSRSCWLTQGILYSSLNCPKYKKSSKVR